MSDLGRKVADILGQVYAGIYHIDRDILRADLSGDRYIVLTMDAFRDYSTFDGSTLTDLVVLCHDAAIRLSIDPAGPRYFRLSFHQRKREGDISQRMPTIEDAVKRVHDGLLVEEIAFK